MAVQTFAYKLSCYSEQLNADGVGMKYCPAKSKESGVRFVQWLTKCVVVTDIIFFKFLSIYIIVLRFLVLIERKIKNVLFDQIFVGTLKPMFVKILEGLCTILQEVLTASFSLLFNFIMKAPIHPQVKIYFSPYELRIIEIRYEFMFCF